jgi:hypothetical protein
LEKSLTVGACVSGTDEATGGFPTVKHIRPVSLNVPARAAGWQDAVCILVTTINGILEAFGGASPFGGYIVDKCTIPAPPS